MVLFVDRHLYMLHIFVCICIYTYTYISKKPRKYCKSNCNLRSLPIISPGLTVTEKEIIMQFKLLHSLISALFLVLFSCFHCSSGSQGWHLHFGGGHQSKLSASEVLCQKKYICVGGFFFSLGSFGGFHTIATMLIQLLLYSLVCNFMLHPNLLQIVTFRYVGYYSFVCFITPKTTFVKLQICIFFNQPWVSFSQLWCLQCQAYAPSFITLSLYSSTSCRGCPPSSTSALKLGLYFSVLHDCVRFVNTSRYTENLLAALIYVKLQLYHKKKKKHPINQPTNQPKTNPQTKKANNQAKKIPK